MATQPNFVDQLKTKYEQLSPKNKKKLILGSVVVGVLVLATISTSVMEMMSGKDDKRNRRSQIPIQKFSLAGKPTDTLAMQELVAKQKQSDDLVQKILRGEVKPGEMDPNKGKPQELSAAQELEEFKSRTLFFQCLTIWGVT